MLPEDGDGESLRENPDAISSQDLGHRGGGSGRLQVGSGLDRHTFAIVVFQANRFGFAR